MGRLGMPLGRVNIALEPYIGGESPPVYAIFPSEKFIRFFPLKK